MAAPTVNVTATIYDQSGAAVSGARVTALLDRLDVDSGVGYIFPDLNTFTTDANGQVVMPLWPNALGARESRYRFRAYDPDTNDKILDTMGAVPNTNINLYEIAEVPAYPGQSSLQLSLTAHIADTSVHGVSGDVVGTTDSQTLTNKTVVVSSNTITTAASGNLTSTELNAALAELQGDIDSIGAIDVSYKGDYDASTNTPDLDTSPSGVIIGDMYRVSVSGNFFTFAALPDDILIAQIDNATLEADWTILRPEANVQHQSISGAGTNTHAQIDSHIGDSTIHFTEASIDHGSIAGLGDDDHTQYHNDTRGDARYYRENEHISTSAGAGDAGKPIILDAAGHVDATMINDADIDHANIGSIGTNTHAQIDTHIADSTIHFTEASIDHGSIAGLGDDDHTQYHNDTRGDARYYRENEHIATSTGVPDASKPIILDAAGHIDATMINDADIDHTNIGSIGTNTHAQIDTHIADSTIHFTEASIDHTAITNIGTNTHAQIDTHIADSTIHFTEASIDHTAITNIGTNTHAQIDTHISDNITTTGENPHGLQLHKHNATAAPGLTDDGANTSGNGVFGVGSRWIDVTNDKEYVCLDSTTSTAVWKETTAGAGLSPVVAAIALG